MQTGFEIDGEKRIARSLDDKIYEFGIAKAVGNWIAIPIIQICIKYERNRLYNSGRVQYIL